MEDNVLLLLLLLLLQTLVPQLRFLQVVAVFCLVSAYELGPGPISWFIAAELFDQQARPIAMAMTSMLNWGGKFFLALIFPPLLVSKAFPFIFLAIPLFSFTFPSVIHNSNSPLLLAKYPGFCFLIYFLYISVCTYDP